MASRLTAFQVTLLSTLFVACSNSGSTVVIKSNDTGTNSEDSPNTDGSNYPQPDYQYWSGERSISFPGLCTFSIQEEGFRINDTTDPLLTLIETDCPQCQVYQITNTPETFDCAELGSLPTGGIRYRILSFQEQYSDGTLNLTSGSVELWHAIETDDGWVLDFITEANLDETSPNHTWTYQATNNFQAFTFTEDSRLSLSEE